MKYSLTIDSKTYSVNVGEIVAGQVQVAVNGKTFQVAVQNVFAEAPKSIPLPAVHVPEPVTPKKEVPAVRPATGSGIVIAPIPGLISEIRVKVGDSVKAGQCVATMEAMKMENHLNSSVAGIVQEISVQKGSEVNTGQMIMRIG
jgi:biotin carboxyl carrier protein